MSKNKDGTTNWVDFSSQSGVWYTPEDFIGRVEVYFGGQIPLDPCTRSDNPTNAKVFFTPQDDGLTKDWSKYGGAFVNPPYGKDNNGHAWIEKIHEEAQKGVPLVHLTSATRFETKYAQAQMLIPELRAVCFVKGRIQFIDAWGVVGKSNNRPSIVYGYNVSQERFAKAFKPRGRVFKTQLM